MKTITLLLAFTFVSTLTAQNRVPNRDRGGYIIKKTADGRTIKIPRRQEFDFDGSDIKGKTSVPTEGIIGRRRRPKRKLLIPIRKSFRQEGLRSFGFGIR